MKREELVKGVEETWGQTPLGDICLLLIDRIFAINPAETRALTYRNMLDFIGHDNVSPELIAALNVLTTSRFAILDAGGFLVDEDDESFELTPEQLEEVVRSNTLVHPIKGEAVKDAAKKVCPFFSLKEDVVERSNAHE